MKKNNHKIPALKQNRTLDTMPNECSVKYPDIMIGIDAALGKDNCTAVIFDRKTGKILSKKDLQRDLSVKIERKMVDAIHEAYGFADFNSTEKDRWAIEG